MNIYLDIFQDIPGRNITISFPYNPTLQPYYNAISIYFCLRSFTKGGSSVVGSLVGGSPYI